MESTRKDKKPKVERFIRKWEARGNVSETFKEGTLDWLIGLGVPEEDARQHEWGQTIEVKKRDQFIWVRHAYVYYSYPGSAGDRSYRRSFIADGKLIASIEGDRNNCWNAYQTDGRGGINIDETDETEAKNLFSWLSSDGAREFDKAALAILKGEATYEDCGDLGAQEARRRERLFGRRK